MPTSGYLAIIFYFAQTKKLKTVAVNRVLQTFGSFHSSFYCIQLFCWFSPPRCLFVICVNLTSSKLHSSSSVVADWGFGCSPRACVFLGSERSSCALSRWRQLNVEQRICCIFHAAFPWWCSAAAERAHARAHARKSQNSFYWLPRVKVFTLTAVVLSSANIHAGIWGLHFTWGSSVCARAREPPVRLSLWLSNSICPVRG